MLLMLLLSCYDILCYVILECTTSCCFFGMERGRWWIVKCAFKLAESAIKHTGFALCLGGFGGHFVLQDTTNSHLFSLVNGYE
jgi:hypothetical protein